MSPEFSVVIPAYNRVHLVGRAIESALSQSVPPDEVIVVDDGSVDGTADLAEAYDGVRCLRLPNGGPAAARNAGAGEARFPWIAWLDSDDFWLDGHLERMRAAIVETNGRAAYYFTDLRRPVDGSLVSHWQRCGFSIEGDHHVAEDGADWALLPKRPQLMQASVTNLGAFRSVGGMWSRLRMNEDGHLFMKMGFGAPVCAVAGFGAEMTDDAAPQDRLFGGASRLATREYKEELVDMYADLLAHHRPIEAHQRDVIRSRLERAHSSLARMDFVDRRPSGAVRHTIGAFRADPGRLARRACEKVRSIGRRRVVT